MAVKNTKSAVPKTRVNRIVLPKKTGTKTAASNSSTAKTSTPRVRVRMYRVGFGDCFLITLFQGKKPQHILVDCGVHAKGDAGTIHDVVRNIAEVTNKQLAIVIMTHVHQDHISGFGTCADQFAEFEVGEVWMPWTEDEGDAEAQRIHRKRASLAMHLQQSFAASGELDDELEATLVNLTGASPGLSLASNRSSMDLLRSGWKNQPKIRYYEAGEEPRLPQHLTGLRARILGPPRSPEFLKQMDPPSVEHYLHFDAAAGGPRRQPLEGMNDWTVRADPSASIDGLSQGDLQALFTREVNATAQARALAFSIDKAVNNSSLVVLFSFKGVNLLLPGDAQWGNWKAWLYDVEPGARGDLTLSDSAKELLGSVDFYKVSHHGSENATPIDVVEALPDHGCSAMCSTQSKPWPSIPRPPLMDALEKKTGNQVARSDQLDKKLPKGFQPGDDELWVDRLFY